MSKKVKLVLFSFLGLTFLLVAEGIYLSQFHKLTSENLDEKQNYARLITLSDLAITQENSLRHRSLSGVFEIYPLDGVLRENIKESYVISYVNESR